jgi:uncharacterized damage-inducible protein DinB
LNHEQLLWRPKPTANNIAFNLWHISRGEESIANAIDSSVNQIWVSEGWREKFGHTEQTDNDRDINTILNLPMPELPILTGYLQSVFNKTISIVDNFTNESLESSLDPTNPEYTPSIYLAHLTTHKNNHHGQIDYIRGLESSNWSAKSGVGMIPSS